MWGHPVPGESGGRAEQKPTFPLPVSPSCSLAFWIPAHTLPRPLWAVFALLPGLPGVLRSLTGSWGTRLTVGPLMYLWLESLNTQHRGPTWPRDKLWGLFKRILFCFVFPYKSKFSCIINSFHIENFFCLKKKETGEFNNPGSYHFSVTIVNLSQASLVNI